MVDRKPMVAVCKECGKDMEKFHVIDEEAGWFKLICDDCYKRAHSNELGKFESYDPFKIIDELVNIIEKGDIHDMKSEDYELFSFAREMNYKNSKNHETTLCKVLSKQSEKIDELTDKFESLPFECEHYDECSESVIENREPDRDESRD